ncbi:hypothetical protein GGI08_006979 [Coemansia sp. S2]|nr:hypothetical protein GGI08_006979 [Coemansia sp. S2]KAJ2338050.1 hypothetical protein GGH92_007349 [Coemansia sp. RSA 2673]
MTYCLSKSPYCSHGSEIPVPTYKCEGDEWVNLPINLSNKDQSFVFTKCAVDKAPATCACSSCKAAVEAKKQAKLCPCPTCQKEAEAAEKRAKECACKTCHDAREKAKAECPCKTCVDAKKAKAECPCKTCVDAKNAKAECPCKTCVDAKKAKAECPCKTCVDAKNAKAECPCKTCVDDKKAKQGTVFWSASPFASSWSPFNNYRRDGACYQGGFFTNFHN